MVREQSKKPYEQAQLTVELLLDEDIVTTSGDDVEGAWMSEWDGFLGNLS